MAGDTDGDAPRRTRAPWRGTRARAMAAFVTLVGLAAAGTVAGLREGTAGRPGAAAPGPLAAAPEAPASGHGIWRPAPGTTWQWQLTGAIDTSVDAEMFDIDLFDAPQATIDTLHRQGRAVVCYLSAGSFEDWRPDAASFPQAVLGRELGWPGERWLDVRRLDVLGPIMRRRLDLAVSKGCDGVEPDNLDAYANVSGFPIGRRDALEYARFLSAEAHRRGLSIGLKNALELVPEAVASFDWALNEQCFQYGECQALEAFVKAGKAVFGVEYALPLERFCPQANALGFSWLLKRQALDAWRVPCR